MDVAFGVGDTCHLKKKMGNLLFLDLFGIVTAIRSPKDMQCLPYAGFFLGPCPKLRLFFTV